MSHQDFLHCWVLVLLEVLNEHHLRGLEKEARCADAQQGACKAAIRALELEAEAVSLHGRHVAATRRESSSESDVIDNTERRSLYHMATMILLARSAFAIDYVF
jgi:hypothetical protein